MAQSKVITVASNFDLNGLVKKFIQMYMNKGYTVNALNMGTGVSIVVSKGKGGIKILRSIAIESTKSGRISHSTFFSNSNGFSVLQFRRMAGSKRNKRNWYVFSITKS